jgi:transmembrane sensor
MKFPHGLLSLFRGRPAQAGVDAPGSLRIEDILRRRGETVHGVDPETETMWLRLKSELETNRPLARKHVRSLGARLVKPALAFGLVVILVLASELWMRHPSGARYATSRGEHATISLPDSSEVTLNHTSALTVEPSRGERARRVTLKGEAFFRVRKDGSPFLVSTSLGTIRVLGTEFNVLVRDDRLEVAVISGTVNVSAVRSGRDSGVVVRAGEIALCSGAGFPEPPARIPFPGYPGWMNGRFIFYRASLLTACREIESQFDVTVKLEAPRLVEETITGAVDNSSVGSALSAIARLTGNRYRYESGMYIVY